MDVGRNIDKTPQYNCVGLMYHDEVHAFKFSDLVHT